MAESGLYVAREPMTFDFEGSPVFIGPNTVVRAGHPIMKGREQFFTPLVVHYDVAEEAKPTRTGRKATDAGKQE